MRTNHLHQIIINEDDMIDIFYRSDDVDCITVDDPVWIERLNRNLKDYEIPTIHWMEANDESLDSFIASNLENWHLPTEYAELDIDNYLLSKCTSSDQIQRVELELAEFRLRNMMTVLRWLKYFVDTMRNNGLIWGVGRGSSCASYCLFLIGIHKIDSIKYDLDIKEFLK